MHPFLKRLQNEIVSELYLPNLQFPADLVTFNEGILNPNLE